MQHCVLLVCLDQAVCSPAPATIMHPAPRMMAPAAAGKVIIIDSWYEFVSTSSLNEILL